MVDVSEDWPFYEYSLYGLDIRSNRPVPGLVMLLQPGRADVNVTFIQVEQVYFQPETAHQVYASPGELANGAPHLNVWVDPLCQSTYLGIQYSDGQGFASFLINREGSQVQVLLAETIPFKDVLSYFLGPVIGCVLRVRGIICLHAGVFAVGGKALAIIGPKGMGKSTMVAAMAYQGLPVLSDDIAALAEVDRQVIVSLGYPRLRLWPKTIEVLPGISAEGLPKILSFAEKRFVSLDTDCDGAGRWKFQCHPLPLAAIYVLAGRGPEDRLAIRSFSKSSGLLQLMRNTYPEYPLHPSDHGRNFNALQNLMKMVVLREVIVPDGLDNLPQTRAAILDDFREQCGSL